MTLDIKYYKTSNNPELRTQKCIQHNTRVKNVQQCYCIKIIKYFNYVIFMYYVMEKYNLSTLFIAHNINYSDS